MLAGGASPSGDWLLVNVAPESTVLAIVRMGQLMFYRHRHAIDEEPLGALVHQTAMYHEDRLGGQKFARVWLCGSSWPMAPRFIKKSASAWACRPNLSTCGLRDAAGSHWRASGCLRRDGSVPSVCCSATGRWPET